MNKQLKKLSVRSSGDGTISCGVGGSNATHMGGRNWVAIKLNNKKMKIEIY